MYIQPNTTIRILKGVPLDPTYDHTIFFYTERAQQDYFTSKMKYQFLKQHYQRVNRGVIRIQKKAEDLYDCNYLMFQNAAFGDKFFYAFITGVEYVNNEVSDISFEIDVMQTYHFDYELGQCFVEREHSETDNIGENLVPEDLYVGELVSEQNIIPSIFNDWDIVFWVTRDGVTEIVGRVDPMSKTITGLVPKAFPYIRNNQFDINGCSDALSWWRAQLIKPSTMITVAPKFWVENMITWDNEDFENYDWNDPLVAITRNTTLLRTDGTQVKNNKCLIYPYNFLYVTNNQGVSATYKYEYFGYDNAEPNTIYFALFGSPCPDGTIIAAPYAYLKNPMNGSFHDYSICLQTMIPVSLNSDSFQAWFAQRASSNMLPGAFAGEQAIELYQSRDWSSPKHFEGSAKHFKSPPKHFEKSDWSAYSTDSMMGNAGYMSVISMLAEGTQALLTPAKNIGTQGSFSIMCGMGNHFTFMNRHVTPEVATTIDDFFTKYGYACRKLKIPNTHSRPQFNYVKTADCLIEASSETGKGLPADDEAKIVDIYNKGITFWKNPANIGDYSVSNSPASP